MKKLIFLLSLVLLVGCSTDSIDSRESSASLNPPSWIIGTYLLENGGTTVNYGFTFTTNDIIIISLTSQNSLVSTFTEGTIVNEVVEDAYYEVRVMYPNGTDALYAFEKLNETQILSNSTTTLTKQ